jgi:hypothetical protein
MSSLNLVSYTHSLIGFCRQHSFFNKSCNSTGSGTSCITTGGVLMVFNQSTDFAYIQKEVNIHSPHSFGSDASKTSASSSSSHHLTPAPLLPAQYQRVQTSCAVGVQIVWDTTGMRCSMCIRDLTVQ